MWGPEQDKLYSVEAEKAFLGSVFFYNGLVEDVDYLTPEDFASPLHQKIFQTIIDLIRQGNVADPVSVGAALPEDALKDFGGAKVLSDLALAAAPKSNAREYARIISDFHKKRVLREFAQEFTANLGGDGDATDLQTELEGKLFEFGSVNGHTGPRHVRDFLEMSMEGATNARQKGGITGLPTELADLDSKLGGMHPSDLIILAGRPGMGKTAMATNIAFNVASRDHGVLIFSLEMSGEQLALREAAGRSGVSSFAVRTGKISTQSFDYLAWQSGELGKLPIWIDDRPGLSINQLIVSGRRMVRKHNIKLIVIDYIQLASASAAARKQGRVQELSEITRGLKLMAKDLKVPVLALSQLSRAVEMETDKRPRLQHLRESGTIEQDSDVVMFIFREHYYLSQANPKPVGNESDEAFEKRLDKWEERCRKCENLAELIVAKQRHGPLGKIDLLFDGATTTFKTLAHQQ